MCCGDSPPPPSKIALGQDLGWAFCSIAFVYIFIAFYTKSVVLASAGMLQIILCFPFAFFLYRVIGQVGAAFSHRLRM